MCPTIQVRIGLLRSLKRSVWTTAVGELANGLIAIRKHDWKSAGLCTFEDSSDVQSDVNSASDKGTLESHLDHWSNQSHSDQIRNLPTMTTEHVSKPSVATTASTWSYTFPSENRLEVCKTVSCGKAGNIHSQSLYIIAFRQKKIVIYFVRAYERLDGGVQSRRLISTIQERHGCDGRKKKRAREGCSHIQSIKTYTVLDDSCIPSFFGRDHKLDRFENFALKSAFCL